jgi:CBS-domain-containing membrane protein
MKVRDCMKRNPYAIGSTTTAAEAANIFASKHIGTLPVVDQQGKLVGLLQIYDLLELVLPDFLKLLDDFDFAPNFGAVEERKPAKENLAFPIIKLMHPPISVEVDSGLLRAFSLLHKNRLHDLPVVDVDCILVGIVSHVDIGTAFMANWNIDRGEGI